MGSVGLYPIDAEGVVEDGVILGLPPDFVRDYERIGMPIDPVLEHMRSTGRPVSTVSLLGSSWSETRLYRTVSGRFDLTGFAALPLYLGGAMRGVLYMGTCERDALVRLDGQGLSDLMIHAVQASTELMALPSHRRPHLSPRQQEVAQLAAEGLTNKQIAAALQTGEAAVRKHMKVLHAAFGVRTRTALARAWHRSEGSLSGD
ncbi:MAG: helix-turn-helix transcriptional regulator [Pseudomonadota bacterium]